MAGGKKDSPWQKDDGRKDDYQTVNRRHSLRRLPETPLTESWIEEAQRKSGPTL